MNLKKYLLALFGLFFVQLTFAQVEIPDASPKCKMIQKVGLSEITVVYSRPSMKNRIVFGELVPYDRMWRTGQNEATTIEFSDDVLIEGDLLPKGKYALFSVPGEDTWDIIFYKDWNHFGIPKRYNDRDEILRVTVESDLLSTTFETLLISFDKLTDASLSLQLFWEDVFVELNMEFDTDSKVEANIEKVMIGPSRADYYLAAKYYYDHELNLEKSLDWVNKANEINEKYWQYRLKSLILHKLEDEEGALEAAEESLEMSKMVGNHKYIEFNEKFIEMLMAEDKPAIEPEKKEELKPKLKSVPRRLLRDEPRMDN